MGYARGNKPEYIQLAGDYQEDGFEALIKRYPSGKVQRLQRFATGAGVSLSDNDRNQEWPEKWHYHEDIEETYIVMSGWIAMAVFHNEYYPHVIKVNVYRKGQSVTIPRTVIHNTLESNYARVSVTKVSFSKEAKKDWHEAKVDDAKLRAISFRQWEEDDFDIIEVAN